MRIGDGRDEHVGDELCDGVQQECDVIREGEGKNADELACMIARGCGEARKEKTSFER